MPMDAIVVHNIKSHKQQLNKQFYTFFAHISIYWHILKWILLCVLLLYNHDEFHISQTVCLCESI